MDALVQSLSHAEETQVKKWTIFAIGNLIFDSKFFFLLFLLLKDETKKYVHRKALAPLCKALGTIDDADAQIWALSILSQLAETTRKYYTSFKFPL